jgi:hypothetical protein
VTGTDQDPTATLDSDTLDANVLDADALDADAPVPPADPDADPEPEAEPTPARPSRRPRRARQRLARRRLRRWAVGPAGRFLLPALAFAALLAAAAGAGGYLVPAISPAPVAVAPSSPPSPVDVNTLPSPAPTDVDPTIAPEPSGSGEPSAAPTGTTRPQDRLAAWAGRMSPVVGVSVIALQAYGYAQLRTQQTQPACHLSWTTLAGIGKVESDHGREGGAFLLPDGHALPPIIGAALDGTGGRGLVRDTDHGLLDGDPVYDRAVGPMQFIPDTWAKYQIDADDDGVSDPNDINDAAMAAADYLCSGGRDLADAPAWWSAVLSYNAVRAYAMSVFNAANDYGVRSRTVA